MSDSQETYRHLNELVQISSVNPQTAAQESALQWQPDSMTWLGNHLPLPPLHNIFLPPQHQTPQNMDNTLDRDEIYNQFTQLAQQAAALVHHSALTPPEVQARGNQMPPPPQLLLQSPPLPPLSRSPPAILPLPPSIPLRITGAPTFWPTPNFNRQLGLMSHLLPSTPPDTSSPLPEPDDETPSNDARPDSTSSCYIVSPPNQTSSDTNIESAPEQWAGRSYQPTPATNTTYTPARRNEPSRSRSFQRTPTSFSAASTSRYVSSTIVPSFERAGESRRRGFRNRKSSRSNERRRVGTLERRSKRSYEPPATRANVPLTRSTERSPSSYLEPATVSECESYPGPYFVPSTSGFVPPTAITSGRATASGFGQASTSGLGHGTTRSHLPPPTPTLELHSESRNKPPVSSALKPPVATQSAERSTLRSVKLPGRCPEPPPAHVAMSWPIPDHLPMPLPAFTVVPPTAPFLPPPSGGTPLQPLPRVILSHSPINPSAHTPFYSQPHIRLQAQRAASPLERRHLSHPDRNYTTVAAAQSSGDDGLPDVREH